MADLGVHALGEDLARTPFAGVLISALKLKVTGELAVNHENGEDLVYFQGGVPTGTQVMRAFKPLGRLLLELGWIDMAAMEKSMEYMAQGMRQGEALVEMGAITRDQLEEGVRLLQIRNLVEMARLDRGELSFAAGRPPPPWAAGIPPNALRTLRQVLTVPQSGPVCERLFEKVGGASAKVQIPRQFEVSLDHFDLDDDEVSAAEKLYQPTTLADFWAGCGLAAQRGRALAAELALTGVLVHAADAQAQSAAETSETRRRITDIMGAAPQAKMAKRAKSFEDDRARRRKLLQRAIMSNAPSDRLSRAFTGQKDDGGVQTVVVPPTAPLPAPPLADSQTGLSREELELEALINERTDLLPNQDFFERLGLNRSATPQQIKGAWVKAVQLFHPDHLPPKLAHLAGKQRDIFAAVKEAYDTLGDDFRRREYLSSQGKGGGIRSSRSGVSPPAAKPRGDDAKIAAFRGDALLAKCDYAAAADAFHAAFEIEENGDWLASELWCIAVDPKRKPEASGAKTRLFDAAEKYPNAVRPVYYLGVLARIDNRLNDAEEFFRKALQINPKHLEAGQELRLIERRRKKISF